jgi:hypothetical protein
MAASPVQVQNVLNLGALGVPSEQVCTFFQKKTNDVTASRAQFYTLFEYTNLISSFIYYCIIFL